MRNVFPDDREEFPILIVTITSNTSLSGRDFVSSALILQCKKKGAVFLTIVFVLCTPEYFNIVKAITRQIVEFAKETV